MMQRRLGLDRFGTALGLVAGLIVCDLPGATAQDAASLNPMRAVEKAGLKGFLEHPLFDPARRLPPPPPVVEAAPVVVPPEPPPTLHLLGVIHGPRDLAIAHRDGDEKMIALHTGDRLGNWAVTVVPPVGVRLQSGARVFDYALFAKHGDDRPAAVAPLGGSVPAAMARNSRLRPPRD